LLPELEPSEFWPAGRRINHRYLFSTTSLPSFLRSEFVLQNHTHSHGILIS
jgi:hypothetical protein